MIKLICVGATQPISALFAEICFLNKYFSSHLSSTLRPHLASFLPTCPKCTVIGLWSSKVRSGPSLPTALVEEVNPAVLSSSMTADPAVEKPFSACSCRGRTQEERDPELLSPFLLKLNIQTLRFSIYKKDPSCFVSWLKLHTFCLSRLLTSLIRIFAWSLACQTNKTKPDHCLLISSSSAYL